MIPCRRAIGGLILKKLVIVAAKTAAVVYMSAFSAHALTIEEMQAKYENLAIATYTECLTEATRILKSTGESSFSVDDCRNETMILRKRVDEFDDSISVSATSQAIDSFDAIYPVNFDIGCSKDGLILTYFTEFPHHGVSDSVSFTYRLGNGEAKVTKIHALTSNGTVGFVLNGDPAIRFLKEVKDTESGSVLVKIEASNTFKARFEIKNLAEVASDALVVCPSIKQN